MSRVWEISCVVLALALVIPLQCGYLFTYSVRSLYFGNSTTVYRIYETVRYDLIRLLQTVEFVALIVSVYRNREGIKIKDTLGHVCGGKHQCTKKRCVALTVLTMLSLLATALTALGCGRIFYIDPNDTYKLVRAVTFQVLKLANLVSEGVMWLFVTGLVLRYISEWNTNIDRLPYTEPPDLNTLIYFQKYHRKGRDTKPTRKALQSWFMIQYVVYLLYIYSDIIHIIKPYFNGAGQYSNLVLVHHSLFIAYDVLGFILPYMLALWMIEAHRAYHRDMNAKHLFIDEVLFKEVLQESEMAPGVLTELTESIDAERREVVSENERMTPEVMPTEEVTPQTNVAADIEQVAPEIEQRGGVMTKDMKKYVAEIITRKIEVCTDYDFCPSVFEISVPLNSPGYSMSILVALFALVASFAP